MNLKILVSENDTKILFAFNKILESEGCMCIKAKNLSETLEQIKKRKPNGIFLDISRSESDSEHLFEKVSRMQLKSPLIIITSQITERLKNLAHSAGALGIYEKPLTLQQVRYCLDKIRAQIADNKSK